MTKQELLNFINSLPDDMELLPISIETWQTNHGDWLHVNRVNRNLLLSGYHERDTEQTLTIELRWKEKFAGEFLRDKVGVGHMFNLRQIDRPGHEKWSNNSIDNGFE